MRGTVAKRLRRLAAANTPAAMPYLEYEVIRGKKLVSTRQIDGTFRMLPQPCIVRIICSIQSYRGRYRAIKAAWKRGQLVL